MSYKDWEEEESVSGPLSNKNPEHVRMTREYCDEHEFYYKNHTCEPQWYKNGELDKYIVTLHENQKIKDAFVKKRNKKRNHKPKKYKKK